MSELTPNLKLFKYNTETDAKQPFSINDCMNANWDKIDASLGSLEICDIGMALYVDESKGKRRYLNGQIVDRNANTEAFFKRLQEITTSYPSLLCTEEEWQAEKTLSAFGQVGKFVFNYSGDKVVSVRIPAIVNVQGLFDLQNLGMTVGAGLPNIEGFYHDVIGASGGGGTGAFKKSGYVGANAYSGNTVGWHQQLTFNASDSNPIYGNSDTVQQEAIQYPYFIQIATGSETENNIINEIELNNPFSLFDSKYSDHELNNISWLQSSGQWNDGNVYVDAYNELLTEYNNSESVEETEGSITFKRTQKGYKIALAEQDAAIAAKYTTDGIAWYYLLDTENTQFKLPRTKFGFEGLRDKVGDDIAESLPNISGSFQFESGGSLQNQTGCITTGSSKTNYYYNGNSNSRAVAIFDASLSSSVYQDGAPVQERATQMYLYFYVGETVQNANLIDAGRIGEQLANKLDRGNKEEIIGWGMPDYTAGISIASNFTAPCAGRFIYIYTGSPGKSTIFVNGIRIFYSNGQSGGVLDRTAICDVDKGEVITFEEAGSTSTKTFYPLKGVSF